jgi:hypothetical protein
MGSFSFATKASGVRMLLLESELGRRAQCRYRPHVHRGAELVDNPERYRLQPRHHCEDHQARRLRRRPLFQGPHGSPSGPFALALFGSSDWAVVTISPSDRLLRRTRRTLEAQRLVRRARRRVGPGRCRKRAYARPGRAGDKRRSFIPGRIAVATGSTDTTRPHGRSQSHRHSGICIHCAVMMSPLRGQSGRSGESEDSKTENNAFGHSRSSSLLYPDPWALSLHPTPKQRQLRTGQLLSRDCHARA